MSRVLLVSALALGFANPAFAQHADHRPPPAAPPSAQQQAQPRTAAPPAAPPPAADHGAAPTDKPAEHGGEAVPPPEAGTDLPPDPPTDHAADAVFPKTAMERARRILDDEHGGGTQFKLMANEFEYARHDGQDGYRWDAEAWFGGDLNRFVLKTEGEGADDLEGAEVQALYSRAVGPYTDFQIGLRHDIEPNPSRTFLAVGFESLLPYWFEAEGTLFVGERGQVLGRVEGSYDFLLTQRLVLQPNAEINFASQSDPATLTGSGVSDIELGLRLRYDIRRELSPYIGVVWERRLGDTADLVRAAGEDPETTSFVAGLRFWY